jgi:hypothetical protein
MTRDPEEREAAEAQERGNGRVNESGPPRHQDKAGTDESIRVARDWISKNAGKTGAAAPTVSQGTVILQLK